MNILLYCPFKFNINSSKNNMLGGIETLNIGLSQILSNKKFNIYLASYCSKTISKNNITNIPIQILLKNSHKFNFDKIISSNDPVIFNYFKNSEKYLWIHNKLQIEKSIRKGKFFSIIKNKITSIFVSKYLENNTTRIYNFKKRIIIPNFLDSSFENITINKIRKPYFVWSVQRTKGLNEIILKWKQHIYKKNKKPQLFIFGLTHKSLNNFDINSLRNFNIHMKGRVSKKELIRYYKKSMGMICLGYDETFCLNAIESMACGLPIITFGYSALSEIANKQNSLKVTDFDDVCQKILLLYNMNLKSRVKLSKNCIRFSKIYYLKNLIKIWIKALGINKFKV